jgi:hypothetical protein
LGAGLKVCLHIPRRRCREYRSKKLTGSTIKGYLKPIISWLRENDIILTKSVNISGINKTPTLEDEKSPEPYKLHSVWRFCDPRQAALIAQEVSQTQAWELQLAGIFHYPGYKLIIGDAACFS